MPILERSSSVHCHWLIRFTDRPGSLIHSDPILLCASDRARKRHHRPFPLTSLPFYRLQLSLIHHHHLGSIVPPFTSLNPTRFDNHVPISILSSVALTFHHGDSCPSACLFKSSARSSVIPTSSHLLIESILYHPLETFIHCLCCIYFASSHITPVDSPSRSCPFILYSQDTHQGTKAISLTSQKRTSHKKKKDRKTDFV